MYEPAEAMLPQVPRLRETVLGNKHPSILTSMNNLAEVLRDQAKYEQAEAILRRALRLRETVLGQKHPSTRASMNDLADVLRDQGKDGRVEEMFDQDTG
jgi:hypothetical protein